MAITYNKAANGLFGKELYYLQENKDITFYGGEQPSASSIIADWNSVYKYIGGTNPPLLHLDQLDLDSSITATNNTDGTIVNDGRFCSPVLGLNTGTATWAIWWNSNSVTETSLQSSTIPTQNFLIIPLSTFTGNGVLRLYSTSVTAGVVYTPIYYFTLVFSLTGAQ